MARVIGSGLDTYLHREARERTLNIAMEARETAERLIAEAEEQAAARRDEMLRRTRAQLEAQKRQALAQARLEAKRQVAGRRQMLLERLWQTAQQRLEHYAEDCPAERLHAVQALIEDAARQLEGGRFLLGLCNQDRDLLTPDLLHEFEEQLRSVGVQRLTLAEPEDIWGGAVVRKEGSRQVVDNSLNARLALSRRTLRDEVGRLLVPPERDTE